MNKDFCEEYCVKLISEKAKLNNNFSVVDFAERECLYCPYVELIERNEQLEKQIEKQVSVDSICVVMSDNTVYKYSDISDASIQTDNLCFDTIEYQIDFKTKKKPIKIKEDDE